MREELGAIVATLGGVDDGNRRAGRVIGGEAGNHHQRHPEAVGDRFAGIDRLAAAHGNEAVDSVACAAQRIDMQGDLLQ